jgi:hypothetical protein
MELFPLPRNSIGARRKPRYSRRMKSINSILFGLGLCAIVAATASAAEPQEKRFFEMRTYYAAPGRLEALNARFRDHTCKLFAKHGMENIGYWMPLDNAENKLVYLLAYPSREAREKSWKAFGSDPEWKTAQKASEANGKLVDKAESLFLQATDFSPAVKPEKAGESRTFELRTYQCTPGNLPNLLARFRDHTVKLFERHGIQNIGYWTPADKAKGSENTLIYILAHKSQEAAAESFKNFRADPAWVKARADSETKAGGSLTLTNGVKSVFMAPTDYSQMK